MIIVAIACAYRFYHLDYFSLWADEAWGMIACERGSLKAMLVNLIVADNHPPGYQTMLYVWIKLFGSSDFSVRLPSALAGILAVIAVYLTGKKHFSPFTGLAAALLLTGSFQAIYYSQEARAYSLMLCFYAASSFAFMNIFLDRSRKLADFMLFWISSFFLICMHYIGSVLYAAQGIVFLVLLARKPDRHFFLLGVKTFSPALILYSPWLPTMYRHATTLSFWAKKPDWNDFTNMWGFILGPGKMLAAIQLAGIAMAFLLVSYKILTRSSSHSDSTAAKAVTLLGLLFIPMAILYTKSNFSQSIHEDRHFIYAIPFVCLLTAYCLDHAGKLLKGKTTAFLFMTLALIFIATAQFISNMQFNLYSLNNKEDIRGAIDTINKDRDFLNSNGIIIGTHHFFNHYVQTQEIPNYYDCCFIDITPVSSVEKVLRDHQTDSFYFVEILLKNQPMLDKLKGRYRILCMTELNGTRASKFIDLPPISPPAPVPACPLE